jgi:hypothetical protein
MLQRSALRRAFLGFARRVAAPGTGGHVEFTGLSRRGGTLARSCVMPSSPSREAALESVLLIVFCALILLGIVSTFF